MDLVALLSRDNNNFNLIRVVAALCVLISHSYTLATGDSSTEPLRRSLGMSLGTLAVDVFFVISGFLVSASACRNSIYGYIRARVLRVYPALLAMLALTVFVLCGLMSSLTYPKYVTDPVTVTYFVQNAVLLSGVSYYLPGVFEENPYPLAVNGPLWTLVVEVRLYLLLGIIFWVLPSRTDIFRRVRKWGILALAVGSVALFFHAHFIAGSTTHWLRLYAMFWIGAAMYSWRDSIHLHAVVIFASGAVLLVACAVAPVRYVLLPWVMISPILVMGVASIPSAWLRRYNRVGDYSYGIYIYAFPVQQTIVWAFGIQSPLLLIVVSVLAVLPVAIASWHFIEKPSLAYKKVERRA